MYLTKDFLNNSPTRAVQQTREILSVSANPIKDADVVVFDLTTFHSPYHDNEQAAIMFAQYVVEGHIKRRLNITEYAKERVEFHKKNSPFMFAVSEQTSYYSKPTKSTTIEQVKVEIKENGKIKKGGKQLVAEQMYKTLVIEGQMSNVQFVQQLQDKLGMTLFGARTYAYNMKKKLGEKK